MQVTLTDVTEDDWEEVAEPKLSKRQRRFVASNAYSLAESKFNKHCHPRAIYHKNTLVGFLMYESMDEQDKPHEYCIYRFMIDRNQQGKGIGREALRLAIEEIKSNSNCHKISICYVLENKQSRKFYASCSFEEIGIDEDGEIIVKMDIIEG